MTMANHPGATKPDYNMEDECKYIYEHLKKIFEPGHQKPKEKPDFSKTLNSQASDRFWVSVKQLSTGYDEKDPQVMDPIKDPLRAIQQGDKVRRDVRLQENQQRGGESQAPSGSRPSKAREEDRKGGSSGHAFSQSQGLEKKEGSQDSYKTTLLVTNPPSKASSSTTSATGVDEGSVNPPEGSSTQKKHDKDMEKLTKDQQEIEALRDMNGQLMEKKIELEGKVEQEKNKNKKLNEENNSLRQDASSFEKNFNEVITQLQQKTSTVEELLETRNALLQNNSTLDNAVKKNVEEIGDRDRRIKSLEYDLERLNKELNDLKSRFSKLAGDKLTDQNPDIADLSDPNRAMKLSERFGALYDDAWTDAFEHLTDEKQKLKMKPKDAIEFLLECLKECWFLCKKEAETWMNSLQQVFLHPVQDTDAVSKMQGGKSALRLGSKDLRVIRDACRKIAPTVGVLVKQVFIMKIKKNQKNQKLIDDCMTYLEGCVDVCWLMVLAEPPLHIDFNIKPGDGFDPNRHAAYSSTGEKVEFLVWPPLYNAEEKGGMLSKGTVSTERKIEKPSKK